MGRGNGALPRVDVEGTLTDSPNNFNALHIKAPGSHFLRLRIKPLRLLLCMSQLSDKTD